MHLFFKSCANQKVQLQTIIIIIILAFIVSHILLFRPFFLHTALRVCLVSFYFTLQDSLENFLQGRSSGQKLLQFCLSGNILISPSHLKVSFAIYRIFVWQFFLWIFWIYRATVFWPLKFLVGNLMVICWWFLICDDVHLSLLARLPCCLCVWKFTCLTVDLFEFILPGVHSTS